MAEVVITSLMTEFGKSAIENWMKSVKKNDLNPKKMIDKIKKTSAHKGLYELANWYVYDLEFSEPKARENFNSIISNIEEKGDLNEFSTKELNNLLLRIYKYFKDDCGILESNRYFTYCFVRSYFDSDDCPEIGDYHIFKKNVLDSIHVKNNFGFKKKDEFVGALDNIFGIQLGIKSLSWEEVKDRLLYICWANNWNLDIFSLLKHN